MIARIAFLVVLAVTISVNAELPPGSYDKLRAEAEEVLVIQVTKVVVVMNANQKDVTVEAKVLGVEKSSSGLIKAETIKIKYSIQLGSFAGPQQAKVLEAESVVPAFLKKSGATYGLAAFGKSFTMTPEG
jgi:hypothetical protein